MTLVESYKCQATNCNTQIRSFFYDESECVGHFTLMTLLKTNCDLPKCQCHEPRSGRILTDFQIQILRKRYLTLVGFDVSLRRRHLDSNITVCCMTLVGFDVSEGDNE